MAISLSVLIPKYLKGYSQFAKIADYVYKFQVIPLFIFIYLPLVKIHLQYTRSVILSNQMYIVNYFSMKTVALWLAFRPYLEKKFLGWRMFNVSCVYNRQTFIT